jgi:hypothetical protein
MTEARRAARASHIPSGPWELPDDDEAEHVLPSIAASRLGVPAYCVDYWLWTGKVASKASRRQHVA